MTHVDKLSRNGMKGCFLAGYEAPDGQTLACVIRVRKEKLPLFKKKKHGDRYSILDFGEVLAVGLRGNSAKRLAEIFRKNTGLPCPRRLPGKKSPDPYEGIRAIKTLSVSFS